MSLIGSPYRGAPRTLPAILSQLVEYFKDHDLIPQPEKPKEKLLIPSVTDASDEGRILPAML